MHCVIHHLWHITTPYREEWNIYCCVGYIRLLWWVPANGTSVSKNVAVYICYKWCITNCICWMIYWLFFNLALFHCTIKVATHKYRSTAVHDVSIAQSFCAFNCAVFSIGVFVCYMWDWEMWRVYWLCWIEAWHMWISISWTLCGLFNCNVLCPSSVQTEDTVTNSSHWHHDSPLYYGYTSW